MNGFHVMHSMLRVNVTSGPSPLHLPLARMIPNERVFGKRPHPPSRSGPGPIEALLAMTVEIAAAESDNSSYRIRNPPANEVDHEQRLWRGL